MIAAAHAGPARAWRIAALLAAFLLPGTHAAASLRSLIGGGRPFLRRGRRS